MDNFGAGWEYGLLQFALWRAQHSDAAPSQTVLPWLMAIATMLLSCVATVSFDRLARTKGQLNFHDVLSSDRYLARCRPNCGNRHVSPQATPSRPAVFVFCSKQHNPNECIVDDPAASPTFRQLKPDFGRT